MSHKFPTASSDITQLFDNLRPPTPASAWLDHYTEEPAE